MSKHLSAKNYQENKERLQKKLVKDNKIFLKKKKEKRNNMVVNVTKISQKMKKMNWLSIEKNIIRTFMFEKFSLNNSNKKSKIF